MKKEDLSMAKKKEYRSLKISSIWNYGSNPSPQLRLQGRWLEELGFQIGEAVLVKCEDGKLIITPDTMRAETESREKEFLDGEMKCQSLVLVHGRFPMRKLKNPYTRH
jgi:toxic protein SymE